MKKEFTSPPVSCAAAALPNVFGVLSPDVWHLFGGVWPVLLAVLGIGVFLAFLKLLTRLVVLILLIVLFSATLLWGLVHTDSPLIQTLPSPVVDIIRSV